MKYNQTEQKKSSQSSPKIRKIILDDIRKGGLKRSLRQDFRDIYHFYLDQETRERLSKMGRVKRWMYLTFWIFKSLFLKLAPARRILLVISLILLFAAGNYESQEGVQITFQSNKLGYVLLFIILMLELMDKWLARDELAVGRTVQQAFIPDQNPIVEGWDVWLYTQPANEVGGDLVDYLKFDDEKVHVALADVAGKGLGAALMMAKLQATLRALAPYFQSLAELGKAVNEIFCRDGLPNRFVTLVYLELQSKSGKVRIMNAGHMPPILLKKDKIQPLSKGSVALGLDCNSTYKQHQIEFDREDILIIYSDGITEARNEDGEFFGEQRLQNLLNKIEKNSAESIGKQILTRVDCFIGDARRNDDVSLVILKRT